MKATGLARYKLVVHVTVGQRAGQAVRLASRGLWDASTDSFVSETYENETMFASAQVVRYPCWRSRTTNSSSLAVRHLHRMKGEIDAYLGLTRRSWRWAAFCEEILYGPRARREM